VDRGPLHARGVKHWGVPGAIGRGWCRSGCSTPPTADNLKLEQDSCLRIRGRKDNWCFLPGVGGGCSGGSRVPLAEGGAEVVAVPPVIIANLDGVHVDAIAYARVKRVPCDASRSIKGVSA